MLRTSSSTDSSTSATQIAVKYDGVDGGGDQSVKKLSKSRQKLKSLKGLKNLQRPSVWRNVYRSTDLPSIRYKELELPLELWQFHELFLLGPKKLSGGHFHFNYQQDTANGACSFDYRQGKANGTADALSRLSPVGGRSSSQEHSNPSLAVTNSPSTSSFCLQNVRPPSATSILEMRSGKRRPSLELMG